MSQKEEIDALIDDKPYSDEEMKFLTEMYEGTLGKITQGEIVKGKIAFIGHNDVVLDIGFKSEGTVPIGEFPNIKELKIGDEVEVFLESIEDKDGQMVLSRKRADFMRVWEKVTRSYTSGEVVQGKIIRRIKGGLVVDVLGIDLVGRQHILLGCPANPAGGDKR